MDLNLGLKHALSESDLTSRMKSCGDPKFINYFLDGPPSLQNIAMIAIAAKIYVRPLHCDERIERSKAENYKETLQRLEKIELPQSLKHQMSIIIELIDLEWKGWFYSDSFTKYREYCDLEKLYEKNFSSYWTMEGTVGRMKLLKDVFDELQKKNDRYIDYSALYETACRYCMEEYISQFGSEVLKNISLSYSEDDYPFVTYWTASLRNEVGIYLIKDMIKVSIVTCNFIAFKYFWNRKLTEGEKRSNIKEWTELAMETLKEDFSDYFAENESTQLTYIICFLLAHLDGDSEQKKIFEKYFDLILLPLFYQFPCQRYFLPTFTAMLDFLNEDMHVDIMREIFYVINTETELLLGEMWKVTPPDLQKSFLNYLKTTLSEDLLIELICYGRVTTINSILRVATEEDKREIIFGVARELGTYSFFRNVTNSDELTVSTIDTMASYNLSKKDYHLFKLDIMSRHGKDLSLYWILKSYFTSLDIFWNWICQTQEECKKFKEKYVGLENLYMKLLQRKNRKHVDDFLNWYFETEKEINDFKKSFVCKDSL